MSDSFKTVLEVRRENMKQQKLRKDQFSSSNVSASLPPSATQGNREYPGVNKLIKNLYKRSYHFFLGGSVLLMDEQRNSASSSGDVSITMDSSSYNQDTMQLVDQQVQRYYLNFNEKNVYSGTTHKACVNISGFLVFVLFLP